MLVIFVLTCFQKIFASPCFSQDDSSGHQQSEYYFWSQKHLTDQNNSLSLVFIGSKRRLTLDNTFRYTCAFFFSLSKKTQYHCCDSPNLLGRRSTFTRLDRSYTVYDSCSWDNITQYAYKRATIGPLAKRHAWRFAVGPLVARDCMLPVTLLRFELSKLKIMLFVSAS